MTMSSRFAAAQHSAAPRKDPAADAGVQPAVRVDATANDTATSGFALSGDPLLGMAIASAILFAVLAALMALG
jgi:hypothetical protein